MMRKIWIMAVLVLAACGAPTPPEATLPPGERPEPTSIPRSVEGWSAASQPLTVENAADIRLLGELDAPEPPSTIFDWAFSPDQTQWAALNNDLLMVWDLLDGRMLFQRSRQDANRVFYSPDKDHLYVLGSDGVIEILNAADGAPVDEVRAHPDYSEALDFDPIDGRLLIGGDDGTVKLWSLPERVSELTVDGGDFPVTAAVLSPVDGRFAAAFGDEVLRLYDENGAPLGELALPNVTYQVRFSPDGRYIVLSSGGAVGLWDTEQDSRQSLAVQGGNQVFFFIPDTPYLVLDTSDGLNIWNVDTRQFVAVLPQEKGTRFGAAVTPDGSLLFTAALDVGASVWNLSNLANGSVARGALSLSDTNLLDVTISADGFAVLFIDSRGPVTVWGAAP